LSVKLPDVPVSVEFKKYTTQKIEGRISIDGREVTMPVSMGVAEFEKLPNGSWGRMKASEVKALNPAKPVWVWIHGRANSEESSQIVELARNLEALGVQVVSVDWKDGAADNATPIGLEGSRWIEGVGTWVANQLQAAEFTTQQIAVIGHSWGAYVAYEIGRHIPGGVQTLIALDPAEDLKLLGGGKYKGIEDPNFAFSNVSPNSYAFHSSAFGNRERALTAKYSFDILTPGNYNHDLLDAVTARLLLSQHYFSALAVNAADEIYDALDKHGFAVSLFSEILRRQKQNPHDSVFGHFSLANMLSDEPEFAVRPDNYEGSFYAHPVQTSYTVGTEVGKLMWLANDFQFRSKDDKGYDIISD